MEDNWPLTVSALESEEDRCLCTLAKSDEVAAIVVAKSDSKAAMRWRMVSGMREGEVERLSSFTIWVWISAKYEVD